jgi:hypothetical protein
MASVARQHAEWLSLLEINGPFLSMGVLLDAFPQGLDAHDSDHAHLFRTFYEEWLESGNSHGSAPAVHKAWIDFVLNETLGFTDEVLVAGQKIPENLALHVARENETVRPSFVLLNPTSSPEPAKARLLIDVLPRSQDVEKAMESRRWKASPASRMLELLKGTNTSLGLVTNGEQWMLVSAASGEAAGFITWTANDCIEEPLTLRAFRSLLGLRRFFGVEDSKTIESLLNASLEDQQEVTDQLGYQVRKAVEVFIQAVDRIDQDSNRELLRDVSPDVLYEAALTVMMRLVFLLSAEERGLFLLGEEMYDQHYAVSTLRGQLREAADQYGEEVVSRRSDTWCRLLATFRAVYGGVENDALRLPAYGGNLFDPDRFPFLEGRSLGTHWRETPAEPLPVNNQIVLHLLEALQILRVKVPGGPPETRRLSFSGLGVEQIGHVYEGLLDHAAVRAASPVLGLTGSKNQEAEIELAELERLRQRGEAELLEHLKKVTGRQVTTLKRGLDTAAGETQLSDQIENQRLLQACNNDTQLCERVHPFAKLLRLDTMDFPVVINAGSLYVTKGSERRSSGTYYTPPSLTEPIVKHALDPLVYIGPAEGFAETEWKLKSAKEILDLKVCDMAMGSGAFLVQVCRYLAEKLVEAWGDAESKNPDAFIVTPEGDLSTGSAAERLLPADTDERILFARRYIADKCIYGVDKNDLAVNMAKLSLWLVTLQRDRPFTFLDHALKRGDSLLGVSSLTQIENFSLRPDVSQMTFGTANLFRYVEEAVEKRRALEDLPSNNYSDIETKNRLNAEAEAATAKVKAVADCLIAFELRGLDGDAYEDQRTDEAEKVQLMIKRDADASINSQTPRINQLSAHARDQLRGRRPFHWPVEFPEVFPRGGFDAFVGNPPFMGGQKISGVFGSDFRDFVVQTIANGRKGSADLSVFFLLRAAVLTQLTGTVGLVITSAIAEGDNREVGLEHLDSLRRAVFRAETSKPWPGAATVTYSALWLTTNSWRGQFMLNGNVEPGITPYLTPLGAVAGKPHRLKSNEGKSFIGHYVLGMGFLVPPSQAEALISKDPKNKEVLFPFLNGAELNATWNSAPTRWVINFRQWPLSKDSTSNDYDGPVAEDYPDCLEIVRRLVKPERDNNNRERRKERWWLFGDYAPSLEDAMRKEKLVFAISMTAAKHIAFCRVERGVLLSHALAVLAFDRWGEFGVVSCSLHDTWTRVHTSYNLALPRYIHTDCFLTFPFPAFTAALDKLSENYHDHRLSIMKSRNEGSTEIYNRFHDRGEQSEDIAGLRALHVELDRAVSAAYGWRDLDLDHGFHASKQGARFTISESARREVLDRLLQLNHERYAEEERLGLHGKKSAKSKKKGNSVGVTEEANTGQGKLQLSS